MLGRPCAQETERLVGLLAAMRRSLAELDLGLKGDLTMSEVESDLDPGQFQQ